MKLLIHLVDYRKQNSFGNKLRQKRFNFFKRCIQNIEKPIKILDIGGTESFWINRGFADNPNYQIHLINLFEEKIKSSNISSSVGDATNLAQFNNLVFDIVFSNSVIEHLFTYDNQQRMATEVLRLGKYYFIQTPNKHFPIEPHFLFPYFQFLPYSLKLFLMTRTSLVKGKRHDPNYVKNKIPEIRLLSHSEFKSLFPNAAIYKEKILWLNKSFIAHNF